MPSHVYKHIDITGSSDQSSDHAIQTAVQKAGASLRGMRWFKVKEIRGHIDGDAIRHWQVTVEIGFTIED